MSTSLISRCFQSRWIASLMVAPGIVTVSPTLKPRKAMINIEDTFSAAMAYVMLSRVCSILQLFILNKLDETKIYPNVQALEELERLDRISRNNNPSLWEKVDDDVLKIYSLNCRSLSKHYEDIITDPLIMKSDIICLQETWLEDEQPTEHLEIPSYTSHYVSQS